MSSKAKQKSSNSNNKPILNRLLLYGLGIIGAILTIALIYRGASLYRYGVPADGKIPPDVPPLIYPYSITRYNWLDLPSDWKLEIRHGRIKSPDDIQTVPYLTGLLSLEEAYGANKDKALEAAVLVENEKIEYGPSIRQLKQSGYQCKQGVLDKYFALVLCSSEKRTARVGFVLDDIAPPAQPSPETIKPKDNQPVVAVILDVDYNRMEELYKELDKEQRNQLSWYLAERLMHIVDRSTHQDSWYTYFTYMMLDGALDKHDGLNHVAILPNEGLSPISYSTSDEDWTYKYIYFIDDNRWWFFYLPDESIRDEIITAYGNYLGVDTSPISR